MEKISQLLCLIGFALIMTTCMTGALANQRGIGHRSKHSMKNLEFVDCLNTTIKRYACHDGTCHDSSTYIHGCDTYNDDVCDNLTVSFDVYNTTKWRNTTCYLYACEDGFNDDCDSATLLFRSCTNGDCRSGNTKIHGCYSDSYVIKNFGDVYSLALGDDLDDFFDIPCVGLLFDTYHRARFSNSN